MTKHLSTLNSISHLASTAYIARYSFVQLSELAHHGENENVLASKQQQRAFRSTTFNWNNSNMDST